MFLRYNLKLTRTNACIQAHKPGCLNFCDLRDFPIKTAPHRNLFLTFGLV